MPSASGQTRAQARRALCAPHSGFGLAESWAWFQQTRGCSWAFLLLSVSVTTACLHCTLREWLRRWYPWVSFPAREQPLGQGQPPPTIMQVPADCSSSSISIACLIRQRQGTEERSLVGQECRPPVVGREENEGRGVGRKHRKGEKAGAAPGRLSGAESLHALRVLHPEGPVARRWATKDSLQAEPEAQASPP